ncbi:WD40 repeat-like protein [Piromyces finnis]|uniref:WD40 repeat-like protein n=1 Tax=Piromyces finnis TaxID=1754191 RepID=A0A1Y1VDB6_9FUNG|nr:WD40 repeat-like protein [Piromyces finnis]|eukprot:ORX53303.1 WD40 repeat-like protein [Piromyces finnis]
MDLKLPDISLNRKKSSYLSLEDSKYKKQNITTSISYSNNLNVFNNNNYRRHSISSSQSKELLTSKSFQIDNFDNEDVIKSVLKRFSTLNPAVRHDFILKIFKDCNPDDMSYIYKTLPTLHRDFLTLLPNDIAYEIIIYTSPRDINTFSQVSKSWREIITHVELWEKLYDNIGLKSMYKSYLCKSITLNCIKLSLLTNWIKGRFHYNCIQAHSTGILQMCLYGDYLATAGADRTCKLYDIVSGSCIKVFNGHEKCILCVKMDEKKIITGSEDHTIRLWNIRTGEEIIKLNDHKGSVNSVAFYETTLISGSSDNTIKIWKMESIKNNVKKNTLLSKNSLEYNVVCLRTLFGHTASVQCVDILPTVCVSGSSDGTIRLWHVESGNCIKIIYPSLLKTIPIYKMCPELTKVEEILYEPISCIKLTYNYLVAGTYSGHIYLIDIFAKEITADDIFRPEWTNWKKKNLEIVEAEEKGNIINFISTFTQQGMNLSNQSKTKPNIIDDFSIPCNILTIRGREFAYEELIEWVNTPANMKLNKIYNLDVNAIPILPEYSLEDLETMKDNTEKVNDDKNNQKLNEKSNVSNNENTNDSSNSNSDSNINKNKENLIKGGDSIIEGHNAKQQNDMEGLSPLGNISMNKTNNLSMMDMSDFMNNPFFSNGTLNQNLDSKSDDISMFEKQISASCEYLLSKENISEEVEKPSMIPRRIQNDKPLKASSSSNKQKTNGSKKETVIKKSSPISDKQKTYSKNSKKRKNRSNKTSEKISFDNYIFNEVDNIEKGLNENVSNEKETIETTTDEAKKIENEDENERTKIENQKGNTNPLNTEANNTSKIEKYLKERYSSNGRKTEVAKKASNTNTRRFKLEVSSARWILGVQIDAWRLIAGGCEGRSIFWNHKTGLPIFEINKSTTDIITIPELHAKARKKKQKTKYHKSTIENHTTMITNKNDNNNANNTYTNSSNSNNISGSSNINEANGEDNGEFNETNNNETTISEKSMIDPEKIHSFVYIPGKSQPITDVIFNDRFLIISDIKGKLRIWEVHDFV